MKKVILYVTCLCFAGYSQAQSITFQSELRELRDVSQLPIYRTKTVAGQQSSYDRSGANDDGTDKYLRRKPDSSLVLLDVVGPGVLNRIWTPTPTKDTLDFYVDHNAKPVLSICYRDLFNGKIFPFIAPFCGNAVGGYYCYFPILFQKHLQVVCRGHHVSYHQWQYRILPSNTRVQSFKLPLSQADQVALGNVGFAWNSVESLKKLKNHQAELAPGQAKVIYETHRGGRINVIEIDTAGTAALNLRITWDGEKQPAVDMPLRDFFGYAFRQPAMQGLLAGTTIHHYSNFPMPFDKSARIEVMNKGSYPVRVTCRVEFEARKRDSGAEGRFYASFTDRKLTNKDPFHIFLAIRGKGHYVGTLLKATGNYDGKTSFFEGDDSTATDGKARIHGTGSEDYFNGGFYDIQGRWNHAESGPLSGCLGYGHQPAHTGGYRFYLSDKICFEKNFWHGIEHGGDTKNPMPAHYTSVSFYYCDRGKTEQSLTK